MRLHVQVRPASRSMAYPVRRRPRRAALSEDWEIKIKIKIKIKNDASARPDREATTCFERKVTKQRPNL